MNKIPLAKGITKIKSNHPASNDQGVELVIALEAINLPFASRFCAHPVKIATKKTKQNTFKIFLVLLSNTIYFSILFNIFLYKYFSSFRLELKSKSKYLFLIITI